MADHNLDPSGNDSGQAYRPDLGWNIDPLPDARSSSSAPGWRRVDDYESLADRYSSTGWGRPSFFHNILHPAENRHQARQHSPEPIPPSPSLRTNNDHSTVLPPLAPGPGPGPSEMPRRSGYIDLTTSRTDIMPQTRSQRQRQALNPLQQDPQPTEAGPSAKRRRRNDGSSQAASAAHAPQNIDPIDLSGEDDGPIETTLQKQRAEAVQAQASPANKALRMSSLTCIICLDTPTNLTVTACGHWFCHTCLMEALIAGESRDENRRSQCPVCRKTLNRNKATDVFPALLKQGLATQPRKKKA